MRLCLPPPPGLNMQQPAIELGTGWGQAAPPTLSGGLWPAGGMWPVAWALRQPCPGQGGPAACQASDVLHINLPSASAQRGSNPVSGIDEGGKRMRRTLIPAFQLRLAQRPLSPVRAPRLGGGRRPCPRWPQSFCAAHYPATGIPGSSPGPGPCPTRSPEPTGRLEALAGAALPLGKSLPLFLPPGSERGRGRCWAGSGDLAVPAP